MLEPVNAAGPSSPWSVPDPVSLQAGDILLANTEAGRLNLQGVAEEVGALAEDQRGPVRDALNQQLSPAQQGELSRLIEAARPRNEEGFGAFFEGVTLGDFSQNSSWSTMAGQVVGGLIPFYGQAADLRDTASAIGKVWNGESGGGLALGASVVGWIPLVGDVAKSAIRVGARQADNVLEVGGKVFRAVPEQTVVNALRNFDSVRHQVGGRTYLLDRSDMQHMLQRHHPNYWNGSLPPGGGPQSFLDPRMGIEDVSRVATDILRQNRAILENPPGGARIFQVTGTVDGHTYVVGLSNGHIRQLYPK